MAAKGDRILLDRGYGTIDPAGGAVHAAGERWRLASITKQVVAAQVVAGLESKPGVLDAPIPREVAPGVGFIPALAGLTVRQLLTHHSGLANPDDTPPGAGGVPGAYLKRAPDVAYCASKPGTPGAAFAYNNCDYLLVGAWRGTDRWPQGMAMATAGERGVPGYVKGRPEPAIQLASFGAAGGLIGTARDVFRFDRALMTGRLMAPASLAALWTPEGKGSYQALGQWVFPGTLAGCATPRRIVQRDGEIGGVQVRNFILPDDAIVVIVFTNRSSDDFAFGEVWEGKGFVYDLLSAAACS
nr:serine hydrolase domain-containing protein [Sphingomonas liriopis]